MRSAIVTGANGFVGSEIVRNLVNHGFNVYALYNRSKNRLETIEKCRTVHCPMDQFSKIPEMIQDSPDFIFHCAWSGSSGGRSYQYSTSTIKRYFYLRFNRSGKNRWSKEGDCCRLNHGR